MKRLSQTFKLSLAAFLGVFSSGLIQLYTAPNASAYKAPTEEPITQVMICHAREGIKPYGPGNEQTVSINSAGELEGGHNTHIGNGQVWSPTNTTNFSDIIPPFYYLDGDGVKQYSSGLGWSTEGQLIYANNCDVSNNTDKTVTPVAPTFTDICELTNDKYTIPLTDYVQYKVNGAVTAAGTYSVTQSGPVTITAETLLQHTFAEGVKTSWEHTFTNEPCMKPVYYLETSHQTTCGQITISLRNVSPWMYRVLIEEKKRQR